MNYNTRKKGKFAANILFSFENNLLCISIHAIGSIRSIPFFQSIKKSKKRKEKINKNSIKILFRMPQNQKRENFGLTNDERHLIQSEIHKNQQRNVSAA